MGSNRGRTGPIWRRLVALVRSEEPNCWLCGQPIDHTAKPRSRWSFSVDHIIPVDERPDLIYERSNVHAAHYGCNSSRGATYGNQKHGGRPSMLRL